MSYSLNLELIQIHAGSDWQSTDTTTASGLLKAGLCPGPKETGGPTNEVSSMAV